MCNVGDADGPKFADLCLWLCPIARAARRQRFEFRDDLRRPLRHFVVAQGALIRLELRVEQHRVFARADLLAAKDFSRDELLQLGQAQLFDCRADALEGERFIEDEEKSTLDRGEFRDSLIPWLAQ